ncbi:hypothetical protein [Nocardioides sp. CFH 31398]|uniref:hypothetical protein n=1 Tax=Nocardioides sp. CFH 31398 TaxID=2919579 RepID=UPI001F0609DA|nr:hypothetical protein [Nocardioides sp. CFH 31398]MCH1867537.1 hypothetical protein [Nocardioides sp. CFH 31398]
MRGQHRQRGQHGPEDGRAEADGLLLGSARVLWPEGVRLTRGRRPPAGTSDWLVLPAVAAPRWLVPARAPWTSAALEGQESSRLRRLGAAALAAGHRRGLLARLPLRRLRVADTGSLVAAVRDHLGGPADVAVRLGSWQHARTVVLRALAPDSSTLAFGKLGIDPAGRAAVRAETDALERVGGLGLRLVVHSTVLHRGTWRGHELLLVSPLLADDGGTGGGDAGRPVDAMRELAAAPGSRTAPLADSGWWARTTRRLADVDDPTLRAELGSHLQAVGRAAGTAPLGLGPCHGDWTAWNMVRDGERVLLWDWEHYGEDVPVGFDAVHFLAQELRVHEGTGDAEERAWLDRAGAALRQDLGLPVAEQDVVLAAYLLDVNLRFVLDRQRTPLAAVARRGWGLPLLRSAVAALGEDSGGPAERTQNG